MRSLTSREWERVRTDPELRALRTDLARARLRCQFDIGSKELYDDYHATAKRFHDALAGIETGTAETVQQGSVPKG